MIRTSACTHLSSLTREDTMRQPMSEVHVYTPAPPPALRFANPVTMLAGLWRHRDLIRQFTAREVLGRYRGSHLGMLWPYILPLVMLAVYMFVFGSVLKTNWGYGPTGTRAQMGLNLFCGLTLFNVFAECLVRAPSLVLGNPNFVKRVVFPLEILPVCSLGAALAHALINVVILIVAAHCLLGSVGPSALLFPLAVVPLLFISLGTGWLLSALSVFFRDIGHAIGVAATVLLFMTPVFYPLKDVPAKYQWVMWANPLAAVLENGRHALLFGEPVVWVWLLSMTAVSFVFMLGGYAFFMRTKRAFADVV